MLFYLSFGKTAESDREKAPAAKTNILNGRLNLLLIQLSRRFGGWLRAWWGGGEGVKSRLSSIAILGDSLKIKMES